MEASSALGRRDFGNGNVFFFYFWFMQFSYILSSLLKTLVVYGIIFGNSVIYRILNALSTCTLVQIGRGLWNVAYIMLHITISIYLSNDNAKLFSGGIYNWSFHSEIATGSHLQNPELECGTRYLRESQGWVTACTEPPQLLVNKSSVARWSRASVPLASGQTNSVDMT